jgi:hypothetical protein
MDSWSEASLYFRNSVANAGRALLLCRYWGQGDSVLHHRWGMLFFSCVLPMPCGYCMNLASLVKPYDSYTNEFFYSISFKNYPARHVYRTLDCTTVILIGLSIGSSYQIMSRAL